MLNAHIIWFGPNLNDAIARQRIYASVKRYCGEEREEFYVFGMMHSPPNTNDFIFFVGNRLFLGIYVDRSLLVIEDNYLNIRKLMSVLETTEMSYDELHFKEEFDEYLKNLPN